MDIFNFTKSKTRQKILAFFLINPKKPYYLRDLERNLHISAGNLRRELLSLLKTGLFHKTAKGRLVYYKINTGSPFFKIIAKPAKKQIKPMDIIKKGYFWTISSKPIKLSPDLYCQTRDVFSVRLENTLKRMEKTIGDDAYLLTAIIGEIGNNSFDHNLGNWPDIPGIFFGFDQKLKIVILSDRGQGILKTLRNVYPSLKDDFRALNIAFTKIISGRFPEKRGNGLKFTANIVKEKNWKLEFCSGDALLEIKNNKIDISKGKKHINGCFVVIKY